VRQRAAWIIGGTTGAMGVCSGSGRSTGGSRGANVGGGVDVDVSAGSSSSLSPPKSSSGSRVGGTTELGGVRLTGDVTLYLAIVIES